MTLKEYLAQLNKLVKENPKALEMQVITSSDDEGNSFSPVRFAPSQGKYEEEYHNSGSFDIGVDNSEYNAVCLN